MNPTTTNNMTPEVSASEVQLPTTDNMAQYIETPRQTMLFDRSDFIPEGTRDEATETLRRAVVLRDYLREHGSGTLEAAIAAAGMPVAPPSPMRACVVNCRAPIVAMREGWAIPSGGIARARLSEAAHGGRIGHYLKGRT